MGETPVTAGSETGSVTRGKPLRIPQWAVLPGGLATALAFPFEPFPGADPLALWPLAWIGLVPFLARLLGCRRWAEVVPTALAFGVVWFLVAGSWVFRVFGVRGWLFLLLPLGWLLAFAVAAHMAHRAHLVRPRWPGPLLTWPILWLGVEFIRSEATPVRLDWFSPSLDPLNFSWFTLGQSRLSFPLLAQTADVWGGFGLSLAPFLVNLLLAHLWVNRQTSERKPLGTAALTVFLVLAELGYGYVASRSRGREDGNPILVGVVQSERASLRVKRQWSEMLLADSPRTQLLVWPEYSFTQQRGNLQELEAFARDRGIVLVVCCQVPLDPFHLANRAYWIDSGGTRGFYDKHERVPLVEEHPPGKDYPTFAFGNDEASPRGGILICYDMDFPAHMRNLVRAGASFVVIPSMDVGAWGGTEHAQHALFARLRAIENRRPIAVASSSGVSQVVDANGQVLASLPCAPNYHPGHEAVYLEGYVTARIQPRQDFSFYTRLGYRIGPLVAIAAGGIVVASIYVLHKAGPVRG